LAVLLYVCFTHCSEAEFVAASQAGRKALYLRKTLKDFGYQQQNETEIYEDYLACVVMSENSVRRIFLRHIDIRHYFVRELVKAGFVKLIPLRTKMVADALTKSLPSPAFIGHRRVMMGQTPFALKFVHSYCVYFALQFSSVQSHLFLSPIGARTLNMPVPYSPPSVGVYTRTPSHNHPCSAVGAQIISLRSHDLVVPKLPACGCE